MTKKGIAAQSFRRNDNLRQSSENQVHVIHDRETPREEAQRTRICLICQPYSMVIQETSSKSLDRPEPF
jgi:hypothetical protein